MNLPSILANTGEPFGLPNGTVRGVLALAFTGALIYSWMTVQPITDAQLSITTLIVGNYFGARGGTAPVDPPEPIAAPFLPGDETPE